MGIKTELIQYAALKFAGDNLFAEERIFYSRLDDYLETLFSFEYVISNKTPTQYQIYIPDEYKTLYLNIMSKEVKEINKIIQ